MIRPQFPREGARVRSPPGGGSPRNRSCALDPGRGGHNRSVEGAHRGRPRRPAVRRPQVLGPARAPSSGHPPTGRVGSDLERSQPLLLGAVRGRVQSAAGRHAGQQAAQSGLGSQRGFLKDRGHNTVGGYSEDRVPELHPSCPAPHGQGEERIALPGVDQWPTPVSGPPGGGGGAGCKGKRCEMYALTPWGHRVWEPVDCSTPVRSAGSLWCRAIWQGCIDNNAF